MAKNKHRGTCIIDIGGKKRGLVFNMNTYAIFCEGMNINLTEMDVVFSDRRQARLCVGYFIPDVLLMMKRMVNL